MTSATQVTSAGCSLWLASCHGDTTVPSCRPARALGARWDGSAHAGRRTVGPTPADLDGQFAHDERAPHRRSWRPPPVAQPGDGDLLQLDTSNGVCVATIGAPPLNVMTTDLSPSWRWYADDVAVDDDVRVVVLRSADPEFFIAHFGVAALIAVPIDDPPRRPDRLGRFHRMCERFRTMPKATICEIAGRAPRRRPRRRAPVLRSAGRTRCRRHRSDPFEAACAGRGYRSGWR